jgi:hypothetical protein
MTRAADFRQADVTRLVRGALKGGMPLGSFRVGLEAGKPVLLPVAANEPSDAAADAERRMKEAFGE